MHRQHSKLYGAIQTCIETGDVDLFNLFNEPETEIEQSFLQPTRKDSQELAWAPTKRNPQNKSRELSMGSSPASIGRRGESG